MPEYTRPATWEDLKRLTGLLNDAKVEYALVGGYAIASHGFPRMSEDIDILVNPAAENSRRWIAAQTGAGCPQGHPRLIRPALAPRIAPAKRCPAPYPAIRQAPSQIHSSTGLRSEGISRACSAAVRVSFGAGRPTAAMASIWKDSGIASSTRARA